MQNDQQYTLNAEWVTKTGIYAFGLFYSINFSRKISEHPGMTKDECVKSNGIIVHRK